jgi:hypothetical protein
MPTYSYKGYDFDVDHEPTAEEFQQLSAYVDTLPPKEAKKASPLEDIKKETLASSKGAEEALSSVISGALGQVAGLPVASIQYARSKLAGVPTTFEKEYADAIQRMTTEPKTEKGQESVEKIGEFINRNVVPIAPMLGVTGVANLRRPATKATAPVEMAPEPIKTRLQGAVEELSNPTPQATPEAPQRTLVVDRRGNVMSQEAAAESAPFREMQDKDMFETQLKSSKEAMAGFDEQLAQQRAEDVQARIDAREAARTAEDAQRAALDINAERYRRRDEASTGYREWLEKRDAERVAKDEQLASEQAQRAAQGEQGALFEPFTNMHRAYEEFFAGTPEGVRPFSPTEFKEILTNLSKEPGTAFPMPEDISAAYKDYLSHAAEGQGDLFGAHEVLQSTSHKTWGELTPQEKAKATRALNKIGPISESLQERLLRNLEEQEGGISYLRSGFTKEDLMRKIPGGMLRDVGVSMIKTPQEAVDLALQTPDVSQGAFGKRVNYLTKGGIFLSAKLKNPVVSFSVDRLLQADSMARAKISDNVHKVYSEALRKLSDAERMEAKALLDTADLTQKVITPEFLSKHGYSEAMKDFVGTHQLLMDDVLKSINEARQAVGKKPISGRVAYSAMSMTGDFRQVVTVDGKTVGVIGTNSKLGLDHLRGKVLAKYPAAEFSKVQDMGLTTKGKKGSPQAAFMDVLDMIGEDNPELQEFLKVLGEIAKDDAANYMGMQKHTMQKKGVWGMEGRKFWESEKQNTKDFFNNQIRYAESAYQWGEMAQAAKDVNDVIRNPEVAAKQDNAVRITEEYMQNAMGINPSRMGRAANDLWSSLFANVGVGPSVPRAIVSGAKKVANTFMMSLSPVFLGMQAVQAPSVMPALTAFLRGRGAAPMSTAITLGLGHFAEGGITLTKNLTGMELSPIEKGAFDYAQKNHVYATDMVEHANQIDKGPGFYVTKATQTPAAVVEQATRAQVFMALVHMMNDAGVTPKEGLYSQAHRFTDMAMVNYGALEKPAVYNAMGPIGSMAYNLKSFSHNELSRWSMYAREIAETKNPVPLLTQMATTIALAGVMGLPFYSQFEELYDFITKKLGKPRSLTLDVMQASKIVGEHIGPNGQFALSNGAPTLLGADLSTRLGLGDVLPSSATDAAFAGGGKLVDMITSTYHLATDPSEATAKKAAITFAPPVLQGPLDVKWFQKGALAMSKDPTKPAKAVARRNDTDVLLKKIGLTGIHESAQKQRVYQQAQLDKAYTEYRSAAMRDISWDLMYGKMVSPSALQKYFVTGQGDPQTFIRDIERTILDQNLSPEEAITLRQSASQRVPQIQSFLRRQQ